MHLLLLCMKINNIHAGHATSLTNLSGIMDTYLADGEIMGWVLELNCGFSFLNKSGEHLGYVILDLYVCTYAMALSIRVKV